MPRLSEQEQQEIIRYLEADRPLPDKYRFLLFEDKREVELVWNGKSNEVCNIVLPFQTIEQVDEPRAEADTTLQMGLFDLDSRGRQLVGWTNKLIWGDNKLILSSLKNGPLREEIKAQGGLKLIYIDPPFDVGADFTMDIQIPSSVPPSLGEKRGGVAPRSMGNRAAVPPALGGKRGVYTFTKKPGILEEIAYRDTWGQGADSYIAMMYERLILMRDLLAEDGSIYVHCDWRVSCFLRLVLDEIFGKSMFMNEIIWSYKSGGATKVRFARKHDTIFLYSKTANYFFSIEKEKSYNRGFKPYRFKGVEEFEDEIGWYTLVNMRDVWPIDMVGRTSSERIDYPTQKPERLLERIIKASSNEGDLVADFFCVRKGTRVLSPQPLSKSGVLSPQPPLQGWRGGADAFSPSLGGGANSPSPTLGKGLGDGAGDGDRDGDRYEAPIESLRPGDLVLTHHNRPMPILEVISREYTGELLEVELGGVDHPLYITPNHPVAGVAPNLPRFQARTSTARYLRKHQTVAETRLWSLLRKKQMGTRFRRQHPMGPFILDFYAPEARLAIEVDGAVHDQPEQQAYDQFRQELIEQYDIEFMRFSNSAVESQAQAVVVQVREKLRERITQYDHKVKWIPAGELQPGMTVFANGQRDVRMVKAIRRFLTTETVYNLRVAEDNSYVTKACTVHNCGSGTTAAVAEKLGRKWIVADLGKFAIHTTRKRMIGVQRQLKKEGKNYRALEILNLGKYERQHYIGVNPNLREAEQQRQLAEKEAGFLALILRAYRAEAVTGFRAFQGKKAGRLVAVGPVNLPVTRDFVEQVISECRQKGITRADILAFEFEMGLFPNALDEARDQGIDLAPKYIPAEVFDKRAVEKNQVVFYDVAYLEVTPHVVGAHGHAPAKVAVELTDFSVFYTQDSIAAAEAALKNKRSKIVVEQGQIIKVSKDAQGFISRELLTQRWSDWIDYWAVDFDYESKREIIRLQNADSGEWEEVWTGDYVFENEWQSFRTKKDRSLELRSIFHECTPGRRKLAIKVVDIFGNDTMKIVEVRL